MPDPTPLLTTEDLEQLQLKTLERGQSSRHVVASPLVGQQPSVFRGRGMELEDVRAYQTGDDVRRMDWRATARSGKPIMKVFREERSRELFLVIDRGPGMRFGTRGELKAARAARVAALLAFSALAAREPVAGIVVDDREQLFSPARRLEGVLTLLRAACAPLPESHSVVAVEALLEQIDRAAERGSLICLISDFAQWRGEHLPLLLHLAARHNVLALRIIDPGEEALPDAGKIRVVSPATGTACVVDTSDTALRTRYAKTMANRSAALGGLFGQAGITLRQVHTHRDILQEMDGLDF